MSIFYRNRFWVGLILGIIGGLVLVLFWQLGLFRSAQLTSSNLFFVEQETSGNVVIVALDDNSLQRFGRAPADWDRSVYADLVERLSAAGTRVIGFDLVFSEQGTGDERFVEALQQARESDARTRIVMPSVGVGTVGEPPEDAAFPRALAFETVLEPIPAIRDTLSMTGTVNAFADVDDRVRRQPSIIYENETARISLPIAIYLSSLRIPASAIEQVLASNGEWLGVTPQRSIHVDENGLWLQNFFGAPASSQRAPIPVIPLLDLLEGQIPDEVFYDKVVLIGLYTLTGERDRYPVPTGNGALMTGVEIQAHAVESLMQNALPRETDATITNLVLMLVPIVSSMVYTFPRWSWKLVLMVIMLLGWLLIAFVVFNTTLIMVPLFYPLVVVILLCFLHIGLDTSREIRLRWRSEYVLRLLSQVSEQRLQMDAILPMLAAEIQTALPGSSGAIFTGIPESWRDAAYRWGSHPADVRLLQTAKQAAQNELPLEEKDMLAIPIRWQRNTLAAIAICHPQARRFRNIIGDFGTRLAPALENALLYEEVVRQTAMMSTVLISTPQPVIVLDGAQYIQLSNDPANRMLKLENAGHITLPALLAKCDVEEATVQMLERRLGSEQAFQTQVIIGDRTFTLSASTVAEIGLKVIVLNDVSHFIELNELKTRTLRMASHDLKNPLSRILGYVHLLEDRVSGDEKMTRYVTQIHKSAQEMEQLIMEILSVERARRGMIEHRRFNVANMVQSIFQRNKMDAENKRQQITLELSSETVMMEGDEQQLRQAFLNLIGNAIKYTPEEGSITVRLSVPEEERIRFEVEDTGYGIPKHAQDRLFTEFYRVRTPETAGISGTGLGLSLVRSVVESHGGLVAVVSEEGAGSKFTVDLPRTGAKPDDS